MLSVRQTTTGFGNIIKYLLGGILGGGASGSATALSDADVNTITVAVSTIVSSVVTIIALWSRSPKDSTVVITEHPNKPSLGKNS